MYKNYYVDILCLNLCLVYYLVVVEGYSILILLVLVIIVLFNYKFKY